MTAPAPVIVPCELAGEAPGERPTPRAGPCTMVIFGGVGDLARRKLMPALAHLFADGMLDPSFAVIGIGREPMSDEKFRAITGDALAAATDAGPTDGDHRRRFLERLHYVAGDLRAPATYAGIADCLTEIEREPSVPRGRLFYLAIPPSLYPDAINHLSESGLAPRTDAAQEGWVRLIIEKPFGHDRESARELNRLLRSRFAEAQVYRIDHYLGKETVQNLLVLRFANSIFEPIWNRDHVDHVQITAAETVGVEHRATYYEESGVLRDMFQNHLLQLLALTAMEPPNTFGANVVREEKVKVLEAVRRYAPEDARDASVIGQYGPGTIGGASVPGYREEPGVAPRSQVPTYAAVRFFIDNWRWEGVPFFVRSGKRLARRVTEIAVQFRRPPHLLFPLDHGERLEPNVLAIRIQPDEGIALRFAVKRPGIDVQMAPVRMRFSYHEAFGADTHSAYETLLLDCMLGDATLFSRGDQVEAAWDVIDPLIGAWNEADPAIFPNYRAGDWGPAAANALLARNGASWRTP